MADLAECSKIWPQMNHLFNEQIIRVDSSSVPCQTLSWGVRYVMIKLRGRVFMLCPCYGWASWGLERSKTLKWDSRSPAPEPSHLSVPKHLLNTYYILHLLWPGSENKKINQTQVWFFWRLSQRPFQTQLLILLFSCVRLFVTPMAWSTPGFLVLHHLLELAQTHVHWVSHAIQPSRPLLSPYPPYISWSKPTESFPGSSVVKNPPANAGDPGLISGSGRSPREGNGNPLKYFLPGKSHGQKRLEGYSPWGCRVRHK